MKRFKKPNSFIKLAFCAHVALAATISLTSFAYAVSTSNGLPVPNYVNGATLKYSSGFNPGSGSLSKSTQTNAANAANSSSKLNVDLGTTNNNVANLNYNTFNIGNGKTVNFNFGATGQAALNKVTQTGDQYASEILGNITQSGSGNGGVFVINPNGILFGANSKINVDSFTASTLNDSSNTFSIPTYKTLTLSKGNSNPAGIYFENGASINTPKSAVLASNGIYDNGANINAGTGNVQLVTGDGVTFRYYYDYTSQPVSPSIVYSSTITPDKVIYPNGVIDKNNAINVTAGTISGNNINIISKINDKLSTPFDSLVNVDGIVTASSVVGTNKGVIYLYANNNDPTGRTDTGAAGVNISNNLTSGTQTTIVSDKVSFSGSGSINTTNLYLIPITTDIPIILGDGGSGINSYLVPNTGFLDNITTKNLVIGNNTASDVSGTFDLIGNNSSAINMTLATNGNINLNINNTNNNTNTNSIENSNSILNFTTPDNVTINGAGNGGFPYFLNLGNINSSGNVVLSTNNDGPSIIAGNINAAGTVSLSSEDNTITAKNINATGNIVLSIDDNGKVNANYLTSGNTITLNSGGNYPPDGTPTINTNDLKASQDIDFNGYFAFINTGNVFSGNNVNIALQSAYVNTDNITAKGNLTGTTITGPNLGSPELTTKDINVGGNVSIGFGSQDGGASINTGNINAGSGVSMSASSLGGSNSVSTGNINAGNGGINIDITIDEPWPSSSAAINTGNLTASSDIDLFTLGTITTKNIFTKTNLTAGSLPYDEPFTKAQSILMGNITAGNNVDLAAHTVTTGTITAGGTITIDKN